MNEESEVSGSGGGGGGGGGGAAAPLIIRDFDITAVPTASGMAEETDRPLHR